MSASTKVRAKSAPASASKPPVTTLPSFSPEFIMFIFNEFLECYGDYYDAMLPYTPDYPEGTPMIVIIADLFAEGKPLHYMYVNYHL